MLLYVLVTGGNTVNPPVPPTGKLPTVATGGATINDGPVVPDPVGKTPDTDVAELTTVGSDAAFAGNVGPASSND